MADTTFNYIQALAYVLNADGTTARWNYPLAVGSTIENPAGLGQAVNLTYTFVQSPPSYYPAGDQIRNQFIPLSAAEITATKKVLVQFSEVANITFTESPSKIGQLTFGSASIPPGEAGFAYTPAYGISYDPTTRTILSVFENETSGDIWLQNDFVDADMALGQHGYSTLLHEVGHALGLKHPFDPTYTLSAAMDNTRYTVMAYKEPTNASIVTVTGTASSYSWTTGLSVEPRSLMPLDILALQYLYGANTSARSGDDTYSWQTSERFMQTIWDGGGTDTIDCSNQTLPCSIDLTAGAFSSVGIRSTTAQLRLELPSFATQAPTPTYDGRNNLAIAYGVTIENAYGGAGNDTLTDNAANNRLKGGPGNDTIDGGAGIDTAVFTGNRASYVIGKATDGKLTVTDQRSTGSSSDGANTLNNVERLTFSDKSLAFDATGSAGNTAKIIGAAFGVTNLQPALNGIGLQVFDAGWTMVQVAEAALGSALFTQIAGSRSNEAVVKALYTNVIGSAPSASDLQTFVGWLQGGMSQADLLVLAANTDLNAQHVNLTGIASTGLEFV